VKRRDQIKMTEDQIAAFLAAGQDLQVASINADGTPHLVTMWFVVRDGQIRFWTYGKSQKIVNLHRDPRISVLVTTGDTYEELKGVSVSGRAELVDDDTERARFAEEIYEKQWGPITDDSMRAGIQGMGAKRTIVVVKPEHVMSWDHSKLSGGY